MLQCYWYYKNKSNQCSIFVESWRRVMLTQCGFTQGQGLWANTAFMTQCYLFLKIQKCQISYQRSKVHSIIDLGKHLCQIVPMWNMIVVFQGTAFLNRSGAILTSELSVSLLLTLPTHNSTFVVVFVHAALLLYYYEIFSTFYCPILMSQCEM